MSGSTSASASASALASSGDVHAFIRATAALVGLERRAELEEEAAYKGARTQKELERAGVLLSRLVVTDVATGLYGRCLLTLESARGGPLPQSELGVRDIVELAAYGSSGQSGGGGAAGGTKVASGVVYRLKESSLTLALDEFLDPAQRVGQLSVLKLSNQVTYDRYKFGLDSLQREFTSAASTGISSRLLRVLYGDAEPVAATRHTPWVPFSQSLNASQKEAVQNALDANDIYMIHGPPGTGKTTTVVELIRQLVARGLRVLACAPSNLAVDNLVEKLGERLAPQRAGKQTHEMAQTSADMSEAAAAAPCSNVPVSSTAAFDAAVASRTAAASTLHRTRGHDVRLVRLGHPARIIPTVLKYTLDAVVASSDAEAVCAGIRDDMAKLNKAMDKSRDRAERNGMRREVRELQRALRERERRAITESLRSTEVVCCTLVNAASKLMDTFSSGSSGSGSGSSDAPSGFDVVVIDEAAQALEVACLLPLLKGRKLILAGDNMQLGPTVKSGEATKGGLAHTLFDRMYSKPYGQRITTMLVEQYRMNETIMKWSSDEMYQGRLTGPDFITKHLLCDLSGVKSTDDTRASFVVIDTAGLGMYEDEQTATTGASKNDSGSLASVSQQRSKSNTAEAALLRQHLDALLAAGVPARSIGIITPYNGQVSLLREQLMDPYVLGQGLEIGTVDGFQGREKEAILISLVRSNNGHEVGFLAEDRRINVAITRARRHVAIVLDSDTVSSHPFLSRLIDYASEHGDYRMAQDPHEVRQDWSGAGVAGTAGATGGVNIEGSEQKQDGVVSTQHSSIVTPSKPKQPKKERVRPALPIAAAAAAAATVSAASSVTPGVVQPVAEEWSESRLVSLCEGVLRAGRRHPLGPPPTEDERTQYHFPPTLNSFERHLVHEVAERVGGKELAHESTGQGMQRFILLRYVWPKTTTSTPAGDAKGTAAAAAAAALHADADDASDLTTEPVSSTGLSNKQSKKQAKKAAQLQAAQQQQQQAEDRQAARQRAIDAFELKATGKITAGAPSITRPDGVAASASAAAASLAPVPASTASSAFDALAVDEEQEEEDEVASAATAPAASTPAKPPKKKKAKQKAAASSADADAAEGGDEEDLDALLSEFNPEVCASDGCSARVKLMGFTCQHCKECYCLKHMNPVLHGCADRHRAHQLAGMKSALKTQQKGTKPMRDSDKALLQNKLDKKIAADKAARTKQNKKEDAKKK